MNETMISVSAVLAGALLGLFFFAGLWWTVQMGSSSKWPALWFLGSFVLRIGIVLVGFFVVVFSGNLTRLLFCLGGFVAARVFTIRFLTRALERRINTRNEYHAP